MVLKPDTRNKSSGLYIKQSDGLVDCILYFSVVRAVRSWFEFQLFHVQEWLIRAESHRSRMGLMKILRAWPGFERRIYKTKKVYEKGGIKLGNNIITYTYISTKYEWIEIKDE